MRKISIILIGILLCVFTGCSNKEVNRHNYIYKGENEFWSAEYKVNGTEKFTEKDGKRYYESSCSTILTVTYKKRHI